MRYVPNEIDSRILVPRALRSEDPIQQDAGGWIILHFLNASFKDRITTLLVGDDDDDCKSHSICDMSTDNFKIEVWKRAKQMWDILSDCKIEGLLPTTFSMTLRPDEACAEYIMGHHESDTSLDDEDRYLSIGMAWHESIKR